MEFEISIRVGEKAFGSTVTISDWDDVKHRPDAESALRLLLNKTYQKALESAIQEAMKNG